MRQKLMRVEHRVAMAALPRRGAHPIEHDIVWRLHTRVERVTLRVQSRVRRAAPVELGKQRREPVWVLVVDRDHKEVIEGWWRLVASCAARSMRSTSAGSGAPCRNCASVPYTPVATTSAPTLASSGRRP